MRGVIYPRPPVTPVWNLKSLPGDILPWACASLCCSLRVLKGDFGQGSPTSSWLVFPGELVQWSIVVCNTQIPELAFLWAWPFGWDYEVWKLGFGPWCCMWAFEKAMRFPRELSWTHTPETKGYYLHSAVPTFLSVCPTSLTSLSHARNACSLPPAPSLHGSVDQKWKINRNVKIIFAFWRFLERRQSMAFSK